MKVMYKTSSYGNLIEEVNINRETESSVFYNDRGRERRAAKMGIYECYFNTKQEAQDYLIRKEELEIERAENKIKYAIEKIEQIKAL